MNLKDGMVDKHIHTVPAEIVCFNGATIYKDICRAEKFFGELLKKDLTFNGIIGSDLPYKYGINQVAYTPYGEMKEYFQWEKKK